MSLLEASVFDHRAPDAQTLVPGDDLLPAALVRVTHSVDIEAPPEAVWPWLVQMGCRRGGWYSWDRLDNGGTPSADRIVPAFQELAVGDILPITATGPDGFAVLVLERERALVLGDPTLLPDHGPPKPGALRGTWAFLLEPTGDRATHLVVRLRLGYQPSALMRLLLPVLLGVHEFMQRKQLRTLKTRVEAGWSNVARSVGAGGLSEHRAERKRSALKELVGSGDRIGPEHPPS